MGYIKVRLYDGNPQVVEIDDKMMDVLKLLLTCEELAVGEITIKRISEYLLEVRTVGGLETRICKCGKLMIKREKFWWCRCGEVESLGDMEGKTLDSYYEELWEKANKDEQV